MKALSLIGLFAIVLTACPSKEGGQKDANAPPPGPSGGSGPLANLESSPFLNETWNAQGQMVQILFYSRENVRVNAQCRSATGQLGCAAIQQIRNGMPVEIPKRELDGRMSAGVKACIKMHNQIVEVTNAMGSQDTFCRFPDGSLLSAGTLEQYGMRVLQ